MVTRKRIDVTRLTLKQRHEIFLKWMSHGGFLYFNKEVNKTQTYFSFFYSD
jgi:hypothetical protein